MLLTKYAGKSNGKQIMALFASLILIAFASASIGQGTFGIVDENGAPLQIGEAVKVQLSLESPPRQPLVYIVQVQDSAGRTVFLSWKQVQDSQTMSIDWLPAEQGEYTAQAFAWTGFESPVPLSIAHRQSFNVEPGIACSGDARCFSGTVTKVTDGDTIRVDDIAVRLALVNTPERGQDGYSEATGFTAGLCPVGSTALVDEDDGQTEGSYGRVVAKVFCSGKMLNGELLEQGHAVIYENFCSESEFGREEWAVRHGC